MSRPIGGESGGSSVVRAALSTPADAHRPRFLIASVGVDGEDNDGKELENAKRADALNNPLTSGADFVINTPRE